MSNFYLDVIIKDPRYLGVNACYDPLLLEPTFRKACEGIIADAAAQGKTLHYGETYRSRQRQRYLFDKGFTKLRDVGVHHYGLAADLILITNGKYDPIGEHYRFLQPLCVKWKIVSGIDWGTPNQSHSFRDWDHVQRIALPDQAKLFSGAWYPDPSYVPSQIG